jgi:ribosome-associated protein
MALTLEKKTRLCATAADSKKAADIVVLDIQPLSAMADHFLICSASSERQVKAIADAIEEELIKQGEKPLAIEGYREGNWVLIDCVDLVIHVFNEETRRFYGLEHLWGRAARVDIPGLEGAAVASLSPQAFSFEEGELM